MEYGHFYIRLFDSDMPIKTLESCFMWFHGDKKAINSQ